MTAETIELAKNFKDDLKHDKMQWPCMIQEKLDGVPVIIMREDEANVVVRSRQGEKITSLVHILNFARLMLPAIGDFVVGEVYCRGMSFKDISGLVRQRLATKECLQLTMYMFDGGLGARPGMDWLDRRAAYVLRARAVADALGMAADEAACQPCAALGMATGPAEVQAVWAMLRQMNPDAEGVMLHSTRKIWNPGKRCWGLQRIKQEDTIDVRITGFEEAISKETGDGLRMVGRLVGEYNRYVAGALVTQSVGIGPGKLTFKERISLWTNRHLFKPMIAEVKYKPDETYDKLREPTFQRWRVDKKEPNIV